MSAGGWFVFAILCHFGAYCFYLAGLRRDLVEPNRASWLIWSAATTVEAATYVAVNPGTLQGVIFLMSAGFCMLVTLGIWRRSDWASPSANEIFCIATCLAALVLWLAFRDAFWAHMLVVAAVPVSFWPTWQSVLVDKSRERSPAWGLWAVGDLATLFVALRAGGHGVGEFAYIFVEIVCHASVWFMVGLATIFPWRSFFGAQAADGETFRVGMNHLGKAVFANMAFDEGEVLMAFTGKRFRADRVPSLMRGASDRFMQIAPDHYLGPSGRIDDLVNHSCDPNAGLRFDGRCIELVAMRAIRTGEEVTWDYSTTLAQNNWHMICQCRSAQCRRVIGNFSTLSPERQEYYRRRNLVAPYLRRRDEIAPTKSAAGVG